MCIIYSMFWNVKSPSEPSDPVCFNTSGAALKGCETIGMWSFAEGGSHWRWVDCGTIGISSLVEGSSHWELVVAFVFCPHMLLYLCFLSTDVSSQLAAAATISACSNAFMLMACIPSRIVYQNCIPKLSSLNCFGIFYHSNRNIN